MKKLNLAELECDSDVIDAPQMRRIKGGGEVWIGDMLYFFYNDGSYMYSADFGTTWKDENNNIIGGEPTYDGGTLPEVTISASSYHDSDPFTDSWNHINNNIFFGGSQAPSYYGAEIYDGSVEYKSDLLSVSSLLGYANLYLTKDAALLTYTAREAELLEDIIMATKASRIMVMAAKGFGGVGTLFLGLESAKDGNGFTWGDAAKVGIGLAATLTPYGWSYAVIDLATGLITGTTITDRLGNAIDY